MPAHGIDTERLWNPAALDEVTNSPSPNSYIFIAKNQNVGIKASIKMLGGEGGIRVIALSNCFTKSGFSNSANRAPCPAPKFLGFIRTNMDEN